ncbi:MFS transporter, partial [Escherichia coli]|nr:MFS transporter [Escherichia coli]
AMIILMQVSRWYRVQTKNTGPANAAREISPFPTKTVITGISVLLILIFSKFVYMSSLSSYYTFYLINKFNLPVQKAQLYLFGFLFAAAAGTVIGGPLGDRFGRKKVIWCSILGAAPFSLFLPYLNLEMTCLFTIIIGLVLSSAFSAILV